MSDSPPRVLLTDPIHADATALLARHATVVLLGSVGAEDLSTAMRSAEGVIVRRQLATDVFDDAPRLRAVMRHGVGMDFIPMERATALRIPVGNTPLVNANSVAEYVIAGMLAHTRHLAAFDAKVRSGDWQSRKRASLDTFELRGRTVGIVGYGAIGKRVAEIAYAGFGMRIIATTTTPSKLPPHIEPLALDALFANSDFAVLACPLTPATRGMVNARVLTSAKPGSCLINVGRGPLIVEQDLVAALKRGAPGGAVLDVFETQPLPADSELRKCANVTLTPHIAGLTADSERAMGMLAVETLLALLAGERPTIVNPEVFSDPKDLIR